MMLLTFSTWKKKSKTKKFMTNRLLNKNSSQNNLRRETTKRTEKNTNHQKICWNFGCGFGATLCCLYLICILKFKNATISKRCSIEEHNALAFIYDEDKAGRE